MFCTVVEKMLVQPQLHMQSHQYGMCLFRVVKTTLSSSYNISGLVPVCWLLL